MSVAPEFLRFDSDGRLPAPQSRPERLGTAPVFAGRTKEIGWPRGAGTAGGPWDG
jgi:hypothetical protein